MSIQRSPEELYAVWDDPVDLPAILENLLGPVADDGAAPATPDVPPPVLEIVRRVPPEAIAFQVREGDALRFLGLVTFVEAPPGRGTEVRISIELESPGRFRRRIEKILGRDPDALLREDLRHFKQFAETGEFPTTRHQPTGLRSLVGRTLTQAIEERLQRELVGDPRANDGGSWNEQEART